MFDDLLNQALSLWPVQQAVPHMEQEVDRLTLRSDFSGMATYQRLEAMSLTGHPHSFANSSTPISWQLPLPYDILFDIIHSYLLDTLPTLRNLHGTCRSLTALCRPLCFGTMTITTKATQLSTFEKFATILSDSPDIIKYIQNLHILDRGRMLVSAKVMSDEEECLCYILTRRYPNLKRMEVSIHAKWVLLPVQVQYAFELSFSLPSLQAVSLEHVQIPADLLSYLHSIPSLEIRCEVFPPCDNVAYPNMHCTPKMLKYSDPRQSEDGFNNIFLANSAPLLSKLEDLEIHAPARQLRLFQSHFQNCFQTLTTLKMCPIHESSNAVGNESEYLFGPVQRIRTASQRPVFSNPAFSLNLESLAHLKSLVLYATISKEWSTGIDQNAFWWMLDTLRTCHQPSLIDNIEIVIQAEDLEDTKRCPWNEVEEVLHPRVGWQRLKELHIRHNVSCWSQREEGYADRVILRKLPVLASMISVRFTISSPIFYAG
jgi:hypothetical protein